MPISVDEETSRMEPGPEIHARTVPAGGSARELEERARWAALVGRIRNGEPGALEELYETFTTGIRFYLCKHIPPDELDDRIHDLFLVVVEAIRDGSLREPERLMGFVRTIVRRQVANSIRDAVQDRLEYAGLEVGGRVPDRRTNPEQEAILNNRQRFMLRILGRIAARDREILIRYYLYEQTAEQICDEMRLTDTQFRLMKSRAKTKFGEAGRRSLGQTVIRALTLRKIAGASH